MTSPENEPIARRTPFVDPNPKAGDMPLEPAETQPTPEKAQSGRTVVLSWCIMLVGFGAIALAAYWLAG